jgi:pimeloyl-ACP methyl ester carboxylesterase
MRTLVMIPGLGSDEAVWRRTIAALDGEVACLVGDTHRDRSLRGMALRILDQAPETFALAGASMGGMVALEMMKIAPERGPVLQSIAVPTAVVVEAEDRLTPLALSREIHDLTPGSTLHVIPDCAHLLRSRSRQNWPRSCRGSSSNRSDDPWATWPGKKQWIASRIGP